MIISYSGHYLVWHQNGNKREISPFLKQMYENHKSLKGKIFTQKQTKNLWACLYHINQTLEIKHTDHNNMAVYSTIQVAFRGK